MTDEKIHQTISATTWSGALISGLGALTFTDYLALGGFLIALGGFVFNVAHKRKMDRLARERFEWEKSQAEKSG